MIRANRFAQQVHLRLSGEVISFFVVAPNAGGNEVLPSILPSACPGNNMIHRQRDICSPAILTTMTIPAKNVLPGEDDFLEWDTNVDREANDAWERHRHRNGMQEPAVRCFDQLGFPQEQKNDSFLDVADAQGLVIVIQNEHFPVQLSTDTNCGFCCAEVSSTS